jgi:hypothetical protein
MTSTSGDRSIGELEFQRESAFPQTPERKRLTLTARLFTLRNQVFSLVESVNANLIVSLALETGQA